jgi:hypothetical protein
MKTIRIGVPCSPAYMVSNETLKAKKVLVTYGGSIGGNSKTYYCTSILEKNNPFVPMYRLTLLTGEIIDVNPKFIVEMMDRDIVKLVSNVTGHRNYSSKVCSKAILTEYIELLYGETPVFVEGYTARHTDVLQNRIVLSEEEIEE